MKPLTKYEQGLIRGFATTVSYAIMVLDGEIDAIAMAIEDGLGAFAKWSELVKYCPGDLKTWGGAPNPMSEKGTFADWYRFYIVMSDLSDKDIRILEQLMDPYDDIAFWTTGLSNKWLKELRAMKNGKHVPGLRFFITDLNDITGRFKGGFRHVSGNNAIYVRPSGEIVYGTYMSKNAYKMRFDLIEDLFYEGLVEIRRIS
jgi:hypothetical protein